MFSIAPYCLYVCIVYLINTATILTRFNFSTLNMAPIPSVKRPKEYFF